MGAAEQAVVRRIYQDAELNGIPATGSTVRADAITIHRMADPRIAETWEVVDPLGLLPQIGVVPAG